MVIKEELKDGKIIDHKHDSKWMQMLLRIYCMCI